MFGSLRVGKDLEFVENLGQRHTTESNGRSATFEVWKKESVFSRYRHLYLGGNMPSTWDPG